MKKVFLKLFLVVAVVLLVTLLSTCKKDTTCKVSVVVKYYYDTTLMVENANVMISKGDVKASGTTNSAGVFETTFKLEAILDVYAEKDTNTTGITPPPPPLTGAAVVRLQPGKTVTKSVFIQ